VNVNAPVVALVQNAAVVGMMVHRPGTPVADQSEWKRPATVLLRLALMKQEDVPRLDA
jgi:hypothetical protein